MRKSRTRTGANLQIIPVMDLLDGQVVHAIAGNRSRYLPFRESQFPCQTPAELVNHWVSNYDLEWIYVADLNAIEGQGDHWDNLSQCETGLANLLLDGGFTSWDHYLVQREKHPIHSGWVPVFGSETLESVVELSRDAGDEISECFLSIDIRRGQVIGSVTGGSVTSVLRFLDEIVELGFRNIILLDLDSVGTGRSPVYLEVANHRRLVAGVNLFAGGGVKSLADVRDLEKLGFAGVLSATAVHAGQIPPGSLQR